MYVTNNTGFLSLLKFSYLYISLCKVPRVSKYYQVGRDQISQISCSTIMRTLLSVFNQCSHITKIFRIQWKKASNIVLLQEQTEAMAVSISNTEGPK